MNDEIKCEIAFWACMTNSTVWAAAGGHPVWVGLWLAIALTTRIAGFVASRRSAA